GRVRLKGTYITIEGPAFSSQAESRLYKSWGLDVVGMTITPEAKLAREAEICYSSICCVTDYDCWKEECVTADAIVSYMKQNVAMARKIIKLAVHRVPGKGTCACHMALKDAIVTAPAVMTLEQKRKFNLLIGKYLEKK
ncbi:MAG: mtaP, partial [Chloroflexi bacterium]|nr:mtaP [Chloroflexota bacterium]